ncbi:biotin synthase BioB [Arcobacter sp. FW59]|nr:biotin synthase BioB [Arcobacter sp. FW59]
MSLKKEIFLCSISNIESGTCNEDCKFCTQSVKNDIEITRYKRKEIKTVVEEAKNAKRHKAQGFCLVTAGQKLTDSKLEYIISLVHAIKKEDLDLKINACNGLATLEQLKELKKAGIEVYNHNLEASKEFYPKLCSTHTWQERYETCLNVKKVGQNLACGGIFGVGESHEDRISLFNSIKSLEPMIVPLNFFHYTNNLPISKNVLTKQEAFSIIKTARNIIDSAKVVMIGGGRESMFEDRQYEVFEYGANSFIIGDYLTTFGESAKKDLISLKKLNYKIAN